MANKRVDELTATTPSNTDVVPFSGPSAGPAYKATAAQIVYAGLNQPNSASAGAGADMLIKAADGVTSGAGGKLIFQAGTQATTGGQGLYRFVAPDDATVMADMTVAAKAGGYTDVIWSYNTTKKTYYQFTGAGIRGSSTTSWFLSYDGSIGKLGLTLGPSAGIYSAPTYDDSGHDVGLVRTTVGVWRVTDSSTGGGSFAYTEATPTTLAANTDNLVLTGAGVQRLSASAGYNLTGIAPPSGGAHVSGRVLYLTNVGSFTITLKHQVTSTATNQFLCTTGADLALAANGMAICIYDNTTQRWRVALL